MLDSTELFILYLFLVILIGMVAGLAYSIGIILHMDKKIKQLIEKTEKIEERIEKEVLFILKEISNKKSKK
ncbi:MAG: hypothetical protein OH319_02875 [Candidatus Parvarchaeota archaeon]|nr:hypothetical protein [Candidatus Jingweiarchaeum tengchongense]MCW1298311.1 hypothetical protein [Candidatus Jingweiarchaeum tengchongense]MCW1300402.1 hypothetical protein [Candidatus Jingweiarchaeum tengchongense]MCW1304753.1 hypothetical protein [Candidatus Jingweiarchaeum tengchongense]MCW1305343.1 hypothetical protein [Candidatus Jingweiarchaeum tengchongense]